METYIFNYILIFYIISNCLKHIWESESRTFEYYDVYIGDFIL